VKRMTKIVPLIAGFFLAAAALGVAPFTLSSPAVKGMSETGFDSGLRSAGRLEAMYAAGDNAPRNTRSFPFSWSGLPAGTKALALVLDDPDARLVLAARGMSGDAFLHWTAADIDPAMGKLADNASAGNPPFVQGKNGAGTIGYIGPQPPSDVPSNVKKPLVHVYRLTVFALSSKTGLVNGYSLDELMAAMKGKLLGQTQLLIGYSNG
jgi:Raf kinase inhibitor-like YbhB/YbcL family protein